MKTEDTNGYILTILLLVNSESSVQQNFLNINVKTRLDLCTELGDSQVRVQVFIAWGSRRLYICLPLMLPVLLIYLGVVFFNIVWGFLVCFSLMVHRGPFDIRLDN